jgi:uncharacterized protein
MPGPTETEFFERADMPDTKLGACEKDEAADVARDGFEAPMGGKRGWSPAVSARLGQGR